jgi:chromosome partitioning protein
VYSHRAHTAHPLFVPLVVRYVSGVLTPADRAQLARVIAVTNGKGGVGKTSTVAAAGVLAAQAGLRTLLVDLNPQGALGLDLGYQGDDGAGLSSAVQFGGPLTVLPGVRQNLDVVPGGVFLEALMAALSSQMMRSSRNEVFSRFAVSLAATLTATVYDLVLLDTAPSLELLELQALAAARWVLIPVRTDAASSATLTEVGRRFAVLTEVNPGLELLGVFMHAVSPSASAVRRETRSRIHALLGEDAPVLDSWIRYAESVAHQVRQRGLTPTELDDELRTAPAWYERLRDPSLPPRPAAASRTVAGDYERLTNEVVTRLQDAEKLEAERVAETS